MVELLDHVVIKYPFDIAKLTEVSGSPILVYPPANDPTDVIDADNGPRLADQYADADTGRAFSTIFPADDAVSHRNAIVYTSGSVSID